MKYKCSICNENAIKVMEFEKVDICKCEKCLHMFSTNVKLTPEEIYAEDYFLNEHQNFFNHPDIELYSKVAKHIESKKGRDSLIADLGCGTGNFLRFLQDKKFTNLTGVDLIKNEDDIINYVQSDILEYTPEEKFDVIVSNMNIEHIEDLDSYIKKINLILKEDGLLILNTINEHSLIYSISKFLYKFNVKFVAQRLYEPHHVNHFSIDSLSLLLQKFNFNTKSIVVKNYPIESVDLPKGLFGLIQKIGVGIVFLFSGSSTGGISQTQFFERT